MTIVTTSQVLGRVPISVLHLHDRINLGNADEVERAARDAYAGGARHVVIDLTNAPSLSSAGLRAIMAVNQLLASQAAPAPSDKSPYLKLVGPSSHVRQVLNIAGFDRYLEVYDQLSEAVASF